MKFKVGIIDADILYLERLVQWFSNGYGDKIELFSFTNLAAFEEALQNMHFDMVLAAENMKVSKDLIPQKTGFAYLVTQNDLEMIEDVPVISKFQSVDMLYKQIVGLYANNEEINVVKKNVDGKTCKVITITSASGGVGTSTIAAAFAKYLARKEKKVLFLSFEKNGGQDVFFQAEGTGNISDVIYLLKSNKNNIALRMESLVSKDGSGVFYLKNCNNLLDRTELDKASIEKLVKEISTLSNYEYIIVDMEYSFDEIGLFLTEYSDSILVVADGTVMSCHKLKQFFDTLHIWDSQKNLHALPKFGLVYNRFSSKYGCQSQDVNFPVLGGTPRYEGVNEMQMVEEISKLPFWEKCLEG